MIDYAEYDYQWVADTRRALKRRERIKFVIRETIATIAFCVVVAFLLYGC